MTLTLLELPDDVLRLVVDTFDLRSLKRFSLCSRKARAVTVSKLQQRIQFATNPQGQAAFWRDLARQDLSFVQHLAINNNSEDVLRLPATFFTKFPNLVSLNIDSGIRISIRQAMGEDDPKVRLEVAWLGLRRLQYLRLIGCYLSQSDVLHILRLPHLVALGALYCADLPLSNKHGASEDIAQAYQKHDTSNIRHITLIGSTSFLSPSILPLLANTQGFTTDGNSGPEFNAAVRKSFPHLQHLVTTLGNVPTLCEADSEGPPAFISSLSHLTMASAPGSVPDDDWFSDPARVIILLRSATKLRQLDIDLPGMALTAYTDTLRQIRKDLPALEITRRYDGPTDLTELKALEELGIRVQFPVQDNSEDSHRDS